MTTFVTAPLSAFLLAIGAVALAIAVLPSMRKSREDVFKDT